MNSSSLKKPFINKRKGITLSTAKLVNSAPLDFRTNQGIVLRPTVPNLSALDWVKNNKEYIKEQLQKSGAILFRGFMVENIQTFRSLAETYAGPLLDYRNGSTPRSSVLDGIYTSTDFPADRSIPQHNEMSYTRNWPKHIFFHCIAKPTKDGQTPIANGANVYTRIPADIREHFEAKGVAYVRNYGHGVDLSWQSVFQTENVQDVEKYCEDHNIEYQWRNGGLLRTKQVSQTSIEHPTNGQKVWFNQAHLFHIGNLPAEIRNVIEHEFSIDDLPRNSFYGDGSPIEVEVVHEIQDAYHAEEIAFDWEVDDILLLDNELMSHGRRPFEGPRKIVVAMS